MTRQEATEKQANGGIVTLDAWTLLERVLGSTTHQKILCKCSCGAEHRVRVDKLFCSKPSQRSKMCKVCAHKSHGKTNTKAYRVWAGLKARCNNPNNPEYSNYGGRGILVCASWSADFENFYSDMGEPQDDLELDRIDVNGPYSKENCRWVTSAVNQANRRPNKSTGHTNITLRAGKARPFYVTAEFNGNKTQETFTNLLEALKNRNKIRLSVGAHEI